MFRWIFGWIVILLGYLGIGNVLTAAFGNGELLFFSASPEFWDYVIAYVIYDGIIVLGSKIAGARGGYKPTFTTVWGTILGWICYLALFPLLHMVFSAWKLIKFIFRLIFQGPKKAFAGSGNIKNDPNWNESDRKVVAQVKAICRRRTGNLGTVGNGTSVSAYVTPSIISHSITVDVKVRGTGRSDRMQSQSDVDAEGAEVARCAQKLSDDIAREIESYINGLQDAHDAWGISCSGSYELSFN
ncbi:MAG: hypothetical protein IJX96_01460 [Clostridia bacterium]|nr:hypothetical protein [Clostridia bacterium]